MSEKKIIVLLDHFSKAEARAALNAFSEVHAKQVTAAPLTEEMIVMQTQKVLESLAGGHWNGGTVRSGGARSALISGASQQETLDLMRCFKRTVPKGADPVFAMVTETGLGWNIGEYLDHIRKEHEFVKNQHKKKPPL